MAGSYYFDPNQQTSNYVPASTPVTSSVQYASPYTTYGSGQPINNTSSATIAPSVLSSQTQQNPPSGGTQTQSTPTSTRVQADNGQWFDNQGDFNAAIDEAYNPTFNYLNQAEAAVNADYPNVLKEAQSQFDTSKGLAENTKKQGLTTLGQNQEKAAYQNESALAAARRLYDQLRTGYNQRFGGSSSAGGAASEISAVEQQRQQGQTQRSYQDIKSTIDAEMQKVNDSYNQNLLQLEQSKQSAINQANRDFQSKLLQIAQSRAEAASAKANARLAALQDLRNKVYQINLQNMQFQQTLQAQKQAAELNLGNYAKTVAGSITTGTNAPGSQYGLNGYNTNARVSTTGAAPTQLLAGNISNKKYDPYGN